MSNLILPQSQQNVVLENNLKVFFARYPHERNRLETLLRTPAKSYVLPNIDLPAAPSKPPIRILLLCGIVNPVFLATILNDVSVQKENFKLFIVENDPEFIAFCFQNSDLTQVLSFEKTEWFICHDKDSIKPAFFRALKPEGVTSMMLNVQVLQVEATKNQEAEDFYKSVGDYYDETARHVLHNHGNLDDSLLGVDVTVRNKDFILNKPGILDLKDYFKGCAALLVGAGPSLEENLETIKKYNDRFVVIAADAALKPLMNAGIRVDYVTSIERLNAYQKPFFENLEPTTADLVAYPVVHPEVLESFPGSVRLVYRNYSFYAYFEKAYPKGILRSGGSTSHLGLRLADYMGCCKIFLVGQDSCYQEKDGLYRSHTSGTGHTEWGNYIPLEDFYSKRKHQPPMKAVNNSDQEVFTNITYYQWIKEYSEELAYLGQRAAIKNCSAFGLKIDGVPYIPLEKAVADLDPLTYEKPEAPAVTFNRNWDNKDLVQNLEGWLRLSEIGLKEAEELINAESIDVERFYALFYLYSFRLCIDDMFIAFVVQCCALRFFDIENRWWSYAIDFDRDLNEKSVVLKDRFKLFIEVLNRLIAIFKKEGEASGE
jgi:hypothetical protein